MRRNKENYQAIIRDREFKRMVSIFKKSKVITIKAKTLELFLNTFKDWYLARYWTKYEKECESDICSFDVKFNIVEVKQ